jgi:hypothetical protein
LKAESFGKKAQSERMKTERDIDKIVRPPFILPHPLLTGLMPSFESTTAGLSKAERKTFSISSFFLFIISS